MRPNAARAVVDPAKVRDYLLSSSHPVGRFKAAVFTALGYTRQGWPRLQSDLLAHAASAEAAHQESGPYGQKYTVSGTLIGPNGRAGRFTTVWLVENDTAAPRFLTAYPE